MSGMPDEHVFLVAFHMRGRGRDECQGQLIRSLRHGVPLGPGPFKQREVVEEWWVAEDDRLDGSDNDSAVFCHKGSQAKASEELYGAHLTEAWNVRKDD